MSTISVLLVDDDRDIREALCEVLEMEGYKVATAENGQVAINYLKQCPQNERPCVILLDLAMPVMNGAEFLAHIHMNYKAEFGDIPVIVASANLNTDPIVLKHSKARLKKPIDLDKLLETVKLHCGKSN